MRVKTFRGKSSSDVLRQIKQTLGEDAVILSSQTSREDGRLVCEMVAAVEPTQDRDVLYPGPDTGTGLLALQKEWKVFKEQLQDLLAPQLGLQGLDRKTKLLLDHLRKEGLNSAGLFDLTSELKTGSHSSLVPCLMDKLQVTGAALNGQSKVLQGIIGPHGVGKTTTLLKLVLLNKRCYQKKKVAVFNADLKQGRGRLFLKHYAQLLDLEYFELASEQDWQVLQDKLDAGDYDRIFVDLPGLAREESFLCWLDSRQTMILSRGQIFLALSPGYSDAQLDYFLQKYTWSGLSGLIWTKLDEAPLYGSILNLALQSSLPVALLTFGPELSGKMARADKQNLLKLLLKHELPISEHVPG